MNQTIHVAAGDILTIIADGTSSYVPPPPIITPPTDSAPANAIEIPFRSDIPRTNAAGAPACFWFRTPATPSAHGATNITIVSKDPAASKLVLSLAPNDFDHPIGDPMALAVSYGDSGETRFISFLVGKTIPYEVSLPLDTVIYANFRYTGDLDGGPIQAYLSNAQ